MNLRLAKRLGQIVRQLFYLVGKVSLTLLFSLGFGVGWTLFLFWSQWPNSTVMKLAVVVGLGIGSGLLARLILQRHTFVLRWLSAWFSQGIGLLYLNSLTGGKTGISVYRSSSPVIYWDGLWQLLLGGLFAFGALSAWRKMRRPQPLFAQGSLPAPQAIPNASRPLSGPGPKKKPAQGSKISDRRPSTPAMPKKASSGQNISGLKSKKSSAGFRLIQSTYKKGAPDPLRLQRSAKPEQKLAERAMSNSHPRRSKGRRLPIRLVGKEEHRCPYCLALVDPQDPDGVVVCSTCHSYHHKSCWDVTGTCQVPHLHS
jgi:hypothetical protein